MVPIPTDLHVLALTAKHWRPFIDRISNRSRETVDSLLGMIKRLEVQLIMVWDDHAGRAIALLGVRRWQRGDGIVADIVWATGSRKDEWVHLLGELEQYLRATGNVAVRPICRPGWSKLLGEQGYRITHFTMEKRL